MKMGFFPRLAWTGMRKNKRIYVPYILTCIGMVMMFYIVAALSVDPILEEMKGGGNAKSMLTLGQWVMGIFSLLFLLYSNSFLIRRRNREFGLYNVLGMDKKDVGKIVAWETLMVSAIGLAAGLLLGIAFSKFAELALLNALRVAVDYSFSVEPAAILNTLKVFAAIFFLLFLNALWKLHRTKPLELLHSENHGDKPPKANWIAAILGALLLGGAYYIAVRIKSPLSAFTLFFVAVVMVIVATYLLFVSGSVAVCRLLQKNKGYYYKKNHFVAVSSLAYRMRRNGAGLASICILSTMVLVTLSSTASLYAGAEDSLHARYPREVVTKVYVNDPEDLREETVCQFRQLAVQCAESQNAVPENMMEYRVASITGLMQEGRLEPDVQAVDSAGLLEWDKVYTVHIVSLEDYNRLTGREEALAADETLACFYRAKYSGDTIQIGDTQPLKIKEVVPKFLEYGDAVTPMAFLVVRDFEDYLGPLHTLTWSDQELPMLTVCWCCGFDVGGNAAQQTAVRMQLSEGLKELALEMEDVFSSYSCADIETQRMSFYATYGGLFFIGIMLSLVFVFAAVLIVYYKQLSEGYEDQARFEIMQKVGMTKRDIRKSINAQVMIVFFAPLIVAGLHLGFAFPLVWKILQMFNLSNLNLMIAVTACAFLVFALFYGIVYRITSNSYYAIVSGTKEQ